MVTRRKHSHQFLTAKELQPIIDRIVATSHPESIVLFGSAARQQMNRNSDVDLLVVKKGRYDRGLEAERLYLALAGIGHAVDITVVTPGDIERYRDSPCLVIAAALTDGRVVYAAA